jgi:hypothetical protein
LAAIKAELAELREDVTYTRHGVELLLNHYSIKRPGTESV